MLLSSFFARSMAFTHTAQGSASLCSLSETFLTIRQNSLYVTVCMIARPSYQGYFIHSLSTLHYCNAPSLATRLTGDYRDRTYTGKCSPALLDTRKKEKKTAYTAPISSAAAPHFIIQPIPLISRSACAIVFGNTMYQRKASIVFRIFAGQKEKSDHLSGSQLWGIWDKSLTQKKRPIPHSKILITKQLHFLKSIFFSLFL